ncbi:hypothetical protein JXB12_07445 [candidate division KSB1 bacterium]|nr:hypothetical protein [candidate division KSB1 bacterium]
MMRQKTMLSVCLLLAIFVTGLFSIPAYATETRVSSMGGVGLFIRDNSNVLYFPATLVNYSDQVIAELRIKNSDESYTIGGHLPVTDQGAVIGVYLNRPIPIPLPVSEITNHLELEQTASLFYATKSGDLNFGVGFSFAHDGWKDDTGSEKNSETANYFGIQGGISSELFDLGIMVDLPRINTEMGESELSVSGNGFGLIGRYFMQQTDILEIVPVGSFYTGSATSEYNYNSSSSETKHSNMDLLLGLSFNYHITKNNLAVLGIEAFGMSKETEEDQNKNKSTSQTNTLPAIYLGVESRISKWLTGRLGAKQSYYTNKLINEPDEGDKTEVSIQDSEFHFSFGFGVRFNSFILDASFNEGLLFDGPNFISGTSNGMTNKISLVYLF